MADSGHAPDSFPLASRGEVASPSIFVRSPWFDRRPHPAVAPVRTQRRKAMLRKAILPRTMLLALFATLAVSDARMARSETAPKPAPEVRRLTALAGRFDGEASYAVGGKT